MAVRGRTMTFYCVPPAKTKLQNEGRIDPGLTTKGLRHTVATTLRKAGMEDRQITDFLGQKNHVDAGHYSRSAELSIKNKLTVDVLDEANRRRTEVVRPFPKSIEP